MEATYKNTLNAADLKACQYCGLKISEPSSNSKYCCEACERLDVGFGQLFKASKEPNQKFKFLDDLDIQKKFRIGNKCEFHFLVEGLQCSSCVHLIEKIPDYYSDCLECRVNFGTGVVSVVLNEQAKLSQIAFLIEELGYKATILNPNEQMTSVDKKNLESNRTELKRIAIAGVCAANLMVFGIGIYSGVDGVMLYLFKALSFILFLPLVFYSANGFYAGAKNSFKYHIVHIDLPIVIALISSFLFSTYNLLTGSDLFYFDSTAGFLFLILVARYSIKQVQQKYLSPITLSSLLKDQFYKTVQGRYVTSEMLQINDELLLESGQIIPVDGILLSNQSLLDTSFYNGETEAKIYSAEQDVFAGYKVLSDAVRFKALSNLQQSKMNQLMNITSQNILKKSSYLNKADRWAQKLIAIVFVLSAFFFILFGSLFSFNEAFQRVLALIVVACPCALAFGSPLTLSLAHRKALKKGIIVKSSDVFEKIKSIKNIFFDKTGTLTEGEMRLVYSWPQTVPDEIKKIILSLEKKSYHPVAFSFRQEWADIKNLYSVKEHKDIYSRGVQGFINESFYEIKAVAENAHDEDYAVALCKDGNILARFYFEDRLRQNTQDVISLLQKKAYKLFLLTGDKKSKALKIGKDCQIPVDNIHYELFPEDKAQIISGFDEAIMIGDGINDSVALSQSQVGIAVNGSTLFTIESADVLFLRGGLLPLLDLLKLEQITSRTLNRNLFLAIIYNFTAGLAALLGWINPLWAAILMPVSTFLILISTLWGFKE